MSASSSKKETKSYKFFLAGACAGSVEASLTCPLDVVKTRMANARGLYRGPFNGMHTIVNREGLRALWSGFLPFWVQLSMKSSIRFTTFELSKRALTVMVPGDRDSIGYRAKITALSGICGGSSEALIWTTPLERLKILTQTSQAGAARVPTRVALQQILRDHGIVDSIRFLYRGAAWTVLRQSSSAMMNFSVYSQVMRLLGYENKLAPVYMTAMGGMISGFTSVLINQPIDVLKTRTQALTGTQRRTMAQTIRVVMAEGPLAFYSGMSARLLRMGVGQACVFTGYGYFKAFIDKLLPN